MNRHSNPFHARAAFARTPQSLLGKLLTLVFSLALLVLAVMFSLVALTVIAIGGTLFAGWLWWKTRALRKAMREAAPVDGSGEVRIIEGEFVREATDDERLPR
ncbi:MAG: hypothetical protein LBE81_12895 [Azonexus sp.]|jgi:hypothetical protein|uniref:hypothetical protein n=1 Tax=Azonexus sp. TaxID=1872668 RepID=UPI00282EA1A1|nr:hypothetical protein [Azonexus sp.]MDR0777512.1 hypothetical protein [Azonexus sp.]